MRRVTCGGCSPLPRRHQQLAFVARVARAAVLAVSAAACVSACGRGARRPEAVVIGQPTTAVTLDPHRHDSYHTNLALSHFYDKLVMLGANLELKPSLAVSWENPSDRMWRFHLRKGVVFHDGRPCEAEDVVASIERARSGESRLKHYLQPVESVTAPDSATVEIVTREPSAVLLYNLVFISVVPRDTGPQPIEKPIGTGPYVFTQGKAGGTIEGERFPRYWGPAPAFRKVILMSLPGAHDRAEAVPSGIAHVVVQYPEDHWEEGRTRAGMKLVALDVPDVFLLALSVRPGTPLADRRVREAISAGIDRRALVTLAMSGRGGPLNQIVPSSVFGYSAELPELRHDDAAARRLLAEAGFARGLDLDLFAPDVARAVTTGLVAQMRAIGVRLRVTMLPQDEFYNRWSREALPLAVLGWTFSNGDATSGLSPLLHSPGGSFGTFNLGGYANARLDDLIEQSERAVEPPRRQQLLSAAMRIAMEDLPLIPLVTRPGLYAVHESVVWTPTRDRVHAADLRPKD